jgi:hypothetical protein
MSMKLPVQSAQAYLHFILIRRQQIYVIQSIQSATMKFTKEFGVVISYDDCLQWGIQFGHSCRKESKHVHMVAFIGFYKRENFQPPSWKSGLDIGIPTLGMLGLTVRVRVVYYF